MISYLMLINLFYNLDHFWNIYLSQKLTEGKTYFKTVLATSKRRRRRATYFSKYSLPWEEKSWTLSVRPSFFHFGQFNRTDEGEGRSRWTSGWCDVHLWKSVQRSGGQWARRASSNPGPNLKIKGGPGLSQNFLLCVALQHCRKEEKAENDIKGHGGL